MFGSGDSNRYRGESDAPYAFPPRKAEPRRDPQPDNDPDDIEDNE